MKKPYYGIKNAITHLVESHATLASRLPSSPPDTSATTIRCAINDLFDSASKDGYRIPADYNQARAVRVVQKRIKNNLKNT